VKCCITELPAVKDILPDNHGGFGVEEITIGCVMAAGGEVLGPLY